MDKSQSDERGDLFVSGFDLPLHSHPQWKLRCRRRRHLASVCSWDTECNCVQLRCQVAVYEVAVQEDGCGTLRWVIRSCDEEGAIRPMDDRPHRRAYGSLRVNCAPIGSLTALTGPRVRGPVGVVGGPDSAGLLADVLWAELIRWTVEKR